MTSLSTRSLPLLVCLCWMGCTVQPQPEPTRYTVVRGDNLSAIAASHGVSVQQLREWNSLQGDDIDVDQVLLIHHSTTPARAPRSKTRSSPAAPVQAPTGETFTLPAARPCVPPPTMAEGEDFVTVGSQGLSWDQAKAALKPFVPRTTSCAPEGWVGHGTLQLDLTVACTGRVASVEVVSTGGLPEELVSCVADRMRYVPFDAHALPDGDVVRYPITYSGH